MTSQTMMSTLIRRGFGLGLAGQIQIAAIAGLIPLTLHGAETQSANSKPNIVVILSDDMGYADVPGFGAEKEIPMPNLDRLARGGVRFTDAYVSGPICVPSRMGLMTGRHQARLGVYTNVYDGPAYRRFQQERLMPSFFKEAGYTTGMFGKWHLSGNVNIALAPANDRPDAKGWDEIVVIPGGGSGYFAGNNLYHKGGKSTPAPEYLTDHFGKLAADFVGRNKERPFFLYLAFNAPHAPLHAEDEDIATFGPLDGYDRARYVPALKVGDRQPAMDRQVYAGMMRAMDRNIGRVLDALDAAGLATNTLVFFLNDNGGPTQQARQEHSYNQACNAPYRGYKFDCLEGGIRTPLFARWPAQLPAGRTFAGLTSSMDILPTALVAAGVPLPAEHPFDGVDLLPYLTGKQEGSPHPSLCWQIFFGNAVQGQVAIRRGNWKLHQFAPVTTGPKPEAWALYDVAADPGESHDLAAQHPEVVRELAAEWAAWKNTCLPLDTTTNSPSKTKKEQ